MGGRSEMGSAAACVGHCGSLDAPGMRLASAGMPGTAGLVGLGRRQLREAVVLGLGRNSLDGTPP
jgi:hypothetical protein